MTKMSFIVLYSYELHSENYLTHILMNIYTHAYALKKREKKRKKSSSVHYADGKEGIDATGILLMRGNIAN